MTESKVISIDNLDEDPVIPSQQFMVLSYLFGAPDANGQSLPLIKVRGSYSSIEECKKRIAKFDKLEIDTKSCPFLITEVGHWLGLYPMDVLRKNSEIDIQYRNEHLNDIMGGIKKSEELADQKFKDTFEEKMKKVQEEATKEGQDALGEKREHPVAWLSRMDTYSHQIKALKDKLDETQSKFESTKATANLFSAEELMEARRVIKQAGQKPVLAAAPAVDQAQGSGSGNGSGNGVQEIQAPSEPLPQLAPFTPENYSSLSSEPQTNSQVGYTGTV